MPISIQSPVAYTTLWALPLVTLQELKVMLSRSLRLILLVNVVVASFYTGKDLPIKSDLLILKFRAFISLSVICYS